MAETATARTDAAAPRRKRRGRVAAVLHCLWLSLLMSVAVEWAGMTWWWPEEGARHAEEVLRREAGYLNAEFRPAAARVLRAAERGYYFAFEWTGLGEGLRRAGGAVDLSGYVRAALFAVQVLMVRMVLLAFSAPAFAVFGLAGLTLGLTLRDIRRWSAGREFGGLYHAAKRLAPRAIALAAVVYLAIPVSVHPTVVIVPGAALFGISALIVAASFKKYL